MISTWLSSVGRTVVSQRVGQHEFNLDFFSMEYNALTEGGAT